MGRLDDKVALVTGGASGFGEATARLFTNEGARVVLTDRNGDEGARVAREIGNLATFMSHDVTVEEDWKRAVDDTISIHGRLDVLMNNAGVWGSGASQDIEKLTLEEWRYVNSINSDGVFLGCRAVISAMAKDGGGSIINVSSIAALRGTPDLTAYGASKGAVRQLTKSVAAHCGRNNYGIRCNSIHPGLVRTPLGEEVIGVFGDDAEKVADARKRAIPLGDLGLVDDIAHAALFLASAESRYVNGSELVIDGGFMSGT